MIKVIIKYIIEWVKIKQDPNKSQLIINHLLNNQRMRMVRVIVAVGEHWSMWFMSLCGLDNKSLLQKLPYENFL